MNLFNLKKEMSKNAPLLGKGCTGFLTQDEMKAVLQNGMRHSNGFISIILFFDSC